jgi:hypothetical protein
MYDFRFYQACMGQNITSYWYLTRQFLHITILHFASFCKKIQSLKSLKGIWTPTPRMVLYIATQGLLPPNTQLENNEK